MLNLFDILQNQGGVGVQGVSQQFGLSPEQTRRAVEALLPAFTIGLQRNAAIDPTGVAQLFGLAGAGMGAPQAGRTPPAPQAERLVGQIFGSPLVSQAVIQQAAAASGVGTQILRQMLPILAGMVVAGIVHVLMQNAGSPEARPAGAAPEAYRFPGDTFWTDMVGAFLPAGSPPAPPPRGAAPAPKGREAAPDPASARPDGRPGGGEPFPLFQQMMRSGLDAQEQNARAMQEIFDAFWKPPPPRTDGAR